MKKKIFLIIAFLIAVALASVTGSILLWRLILLLAVLLFLSYLWARLSSRGFESRTMLIPELYQVGDSIVEEFTLFNRSKLPKLLVRVQEDTDIPGYTNTAIFNLSPNGCYSWRTKFRCQRRGQYRLGALTVTTGDPFGFFAQKTRLGISQNILVCPATLELPFLTL